MRRSGACEVPELPEPDSIQREIAFFLEEHLRVDQPIHDAIHMLERDGMVLVPDDARVQFADGKRRQLGDDFEDCVEEGIAGIEAEHD